MLGHPYLKVSKYIRMKIGKQTNHLEAAVTAMQQQYHKRKLFGNTNKYTTSFFEITRNHIKKFLVLKISFPRTMNV